MDYISGLIGARLFHVIDHWPDEFVSNPIRIFNIWEGGLAIWGGVLGGMVATGILGRLKHWKLPRLGVNYTLTPVFEILMNLAIFVLLTAAFYECLIFRDLVPLRSNSVRSLF